MTNIPFEKYLNVRTAFAPTFSRDGSCVAFLSNITGVPQVWSIDARGGWADQITFHSERISGVWFSPTDDRMIFARDMGGNENAQLFVVNGDGSDERRLTHDDGAMHTFGGWSPDGKRVTFSANRRNRGRYDVYVQNVDAGDAELVYQNDIPGIFSSVAFSSDSQHILAIMVHGGQNDDLYEIDLASHTARHLTLHQDAVLYSSPVYSHDGKSIYCLCNLNREFSGVMQLDLADLSLNPIAQPEHECEYMTLSPDGKYLAWSVNRDGANQIVVRDMQSGQMRETNLPVGVVCPTPDLSGITFAPTSDKIAFTFSSPTRSLDVWTWDLKSNALEPLTRSSHAGVPESKRVQPDLVHYPTFDGRQIPAWFYRPTNATAPYPVIVYVHGGPESAFQPFFFPIIQYFAGRGYGVFAPNVRGSSGFGKTYVHLDDVEKRMDSVNDLAHAVYWLRAQSQVDAKRIIVYGGSYGGFMVLSALTTYPDLWAAGVDIVGISNFVTFLENTSAYRRSHREKEYGSLERDREFLTRISPIHKVDQIRVPLIVIHGANDPRVPLSEAEQMVAALRKRNVPVEFLVYDDEGHGIVKLANKLDAFPKVAAFLDTYVLAK